MMSENSEIAKRVKQTLDPVMKAEGFNTTHGRYWYKYDGEYIFLLGTEALTPWDSTVTGYPNHTFSVRCGVWIDYIDRPDYDYLKEQRGGKPIFPSGKNGELFPKYYHCTTTSSLQNQKTLNRTISQRDILRKLPKVSWIEKRRRDLFLIGNEAQTVEMLSNLLQVVQTEFLQVYKRYLSADYLRSIMEEQLKKTGKDGAPIPKDIEYAALFYRHWGPRHQYLKYLELYEQYIAELNIIFPNPKDKRTVAPYFYVYEGP